MKSKIRSVDSSDSKPTATQKSPIQFADQPSIWFGLGNLADFEGHLIRNSVQLFNASMDFTSQATVAAGRMRLNKCG